MWFGSAEAGAWLLAAGGGVNTGEARPAQAGHEGFLYTVLT
jgi:hypothetical protein